VNKFVREWTRSFLFFFLSFHIVTASHEILGHGLAAIFLGGSVDEIHLSWMGASGFVNTTLGDISTGERLLFEWAGILVTFALAFLIWRRRNLFTWILSVCLFSSAVGYSVLGLHFRYGDPREAAQVLDEVHSRVVMIWLFIALHCALFWIRGRSLKELRPDTRVAALVMILGTSVGTVALLNVAETHLRTDMKMRVAMSTQTELDFMWKRMGDLRAKYGKNIPSDEITNAWSEARQRGRETSPWPIQWVYYPLLFTAVLHSLMGAPRGTRKIPQP
jgi:hypothetical protein